MLGERFVDRERELQALEEHYTSGQAELFVIYGRRRVGKTELIRRFCQSRPHVYFQARQTADRDNLRYFSREAMRALDESLPPYIEFPEWEVALGEVLTRAAGRRLVLVLDEFPYLCEGNSGLPSVLQHFWDLQGSGSDLFLILCGSSVSFMENEVLAYRSPLFGRRTGQLYLPPLDYRQAGGFVEGYSPEDKLRVFGIAGGMPGYLARFDDQAPIEANACRHILQPDGLLYEEAVYVLQTELRDPRTYNSILEAIASGQTKRNYITQRVAQRRGRVDIGWYLQVLERLWLIERVVPLTGRRREKPSWGRYFLADNFLRFWYRFVQPNLSMLEIGEGARVWEQEILPHLDEYMGLVFEDVCREYVRRYSSEKLPVTPTGEVGVYWHKDAEIDVLARNEDGSHYCGECKWSRQAMDLGDLHELERKAQTLPEDWRQDLRFLLFSRSGFTEELRAREDGEHLVLVDLMDLYGVAGE